MSRTIPTFPSNSEPLRSYELEGINTFQTVKNWISECGMSELNVDLYHSYPIQITWFNGETKVSDTFLWIDSEYSFKSERELLGNG